MEIAAAIEAAILALKRIILKEKMVNKVWAEVCKSQK